MTETYIRFRGANASVENPEVGLGDRVEFSGYGRCVFDGTEERGDGEKRPVLAIKVEEVEIGDVSKEPKDGQLSLVADDTELADDDEDEDEDEADA